MAEMQYCVHACPGLTLMQPTVGTLQAALGRSQCILLFAGDNSQQMQQPGRLDFEYHLGITS